MMKNPVRKMVLAIVAIVAIVAVISAVCHFACTSSDSDWLMHPIDQSKRLDVSVSGTPKKIAQMAPEDIIVTVNGYPLRKKDYDIYMAMLKKTIYKKVQNNLGEADQLFDQMRAKFVDQFVSNRMLIDDARKQNIMADETLCAKTREELSAAAEKEKTTLDGLIAKYGQYARYFAYQTAERILIRELVAQKIPPVTEVDMTFVSNTQAQVTLENNIASATNSLRRQLIEGLRKDIVSGKTTFEAQVEKYAKDGRFEIGEHGEWETVSRGDFINQTLEEAVFSAKEGYVLPVQEDDDGIDLVMLKRIIPVLRDKNGEVLETEKRELIRIRMMKEPLFLRQSDEAMFKDLKSQMQLQAVDAYVDNLATNGSVNVVYPYGKDLF